MARKNTSTKRGVEAPVAVDYTTLTEQDKLVLAQDALRGKESDHYRLTLLAVNEPQYVERIAQLAEEVERLVEEVAVQKEAAEAELAATQEAAEEAAETPAEG